MEVLKLTMPLDLTGKLLIAMPGMGDPRFDHSVVYMCAHTDEGAMGLIINKPVNDVTVTDLMKQLEVGVEDGLANTDMQVCFGGPVEQGRGFVLHSPDYLSRIQTLEVDENFSMTSTMDVLEDLATGQGPKQALLMLGYSGWGEGQLESEITRNGWLTCAASPKLVFDVPDADKWEAALNSIGVDPISLSAVAGHA
jgi:putative transcriptional regulator